MAAEKRSHAAAPEATLRHGDAPSSAPSDVVAESESEFAAHHGWIDDASASGESDAQMVKELRSLVDDVIRSERFIDDAVDYLRRRRRFLAIEGQHVPPVYRTVEIYNEADRFRRRPLSVVGTKQELDEWASRPLTRLRERAFCDADTRRMLLRDVPERSRARMELHLIAALRSLDVLAGKIRGRRKTGAAKTRSRRKGRDERFRGELADYVVQHLCVPRKSTLAKKIGRGGPAVYDRNACPSFTTLYESWAERFEIEKPIASDVIQRLLGEAADEIAGDDAGPAALHSDGGRAKLHRQGRSLRVRRRKPQP